MTDAVIGPASASDIDSVEALLEREHLPRAGLRDHAEHLLVARAGRRLAGCAAIEVYEEGALLRSVAVDAEHRGTGLGSALTRAALARAERLGVPAVYLLTTTAERFFPRFGFEVVDRADVPSSVRQSAEFSYACPSSALIMRKQLRAT